MTTPPWPLGRWPAPRAHAQGRGLWFLAEAGFISFGGPAGQIAVMHEELVERRRWISENRFLHALNYCMVLPGPEAQQLATYIGWLMHRTWGGLVAGGLFVLPSLFILDRAVGSTWPMATCRWSAGLFYGIKPAVTASVAHAATVHGLAGAEERLAVGNCGGGLRGDLCAGLPFPLIVLIAGVIGWWAAGGAGRFKAGGAWRGGCQSHGQVIDDHTPTPAHARFTWARWPWLLVFVAVGRRAGAPDGAVRLGGVLTQMGWFFTKAALLTFGGAYAVLPYVPGAVDHLRWLTPRR